MFTSAHEGSGSVGAQRGARTQGNRVVYASRMPQARGSRLRRLRQEGGRHGEPWNGEK